jgi:hypothetical protein
MGSQARRIAWLLARIASAAPHRIRIQKGTGFTPIVSESKKELGLSVVLNEIRLGLESMGFSGYFGPINHSASN